MGRQRIIILSLLIGIFLLMGAWRMYDAVMVSRTSFLSGLPPRSVLTSLLPKDIDPMLVKPPSIMSNEPMRFGSTTSVLSVIQFGDYQCELCRTFSKTAKETLGAYDGNVRFVWRDMPLYETHDRAMAAAIFTRCANAQGKFWEAHDALISTGALDESSLQAITRELRLNSTDMEACRKTPAIRAAIEKEVEFARSEGINTVPFIFVGTKGSVGIMTAEELRAKIASFAE